MKHKWEEFDLSAAASGAESCTVCGLIKNSKNESSPCRGAAGLRPFHGAKESAITADSKDSEADDRSTFNMFANYPAILNE